MIQNHGYSPKEQFYMLTIMFQPSFALWSREQPESRPPAGVVFRLKPVYILQTIYISQGKGNSAVRVLDRTKSMLEDGTACRPSVGITSLVTRLPCSAQSKQTICLFTRPPQPLVHQGRTSLLASLVSDTLSKS